MKISNEDKVKSILKKYLKCKIDKNASQKTIEAWDSMNYLLICSDIEKQFKIKINSKNLNKFNSLKNILKLIK